MNKVKPIHIILFSVIIIFALIGENLIEWMLTVKLKINISDILLIVFPIVFFIVFCKFLVENHEDKS